MKKIKILIVDDSLKFAEGLKELIMLQEIDSISNIDFASNGSECINMVKKNIYDIIFMDYEMPEMNGAEVSHTICGLSRYAKIIGLSFHSDLYTIEKMIKSGVRYYLIKDNITPQTLKSCLQIK